MDSAWPMSRRRKAVKKMAEEAEAGNVKAATLLMAYAYGKPVEHKTVEFTGIEAAREAVAELMERFDLKPEEAVPIVAEQFGVSEQELISEAVN